MGSRSTQLAQKIRERLGERALAGAPQWLTPVFPAARANAGCLTVGTMLGRLPSEDASALVQTVLSEQNADGSWSVAPGCPGDLSLTLEVVHALSVTKGIPDPEAFTRAVHWLESSAGKGAFCGETLILLAALTESIPGRLRALATLLARHIIGSGARLEKSSRRSAAMRLAMMVLSGTRSSASRRVRQILALQLPDGSWEGSARTTVFALAALRHGLLQSDDAAFERGWRFLRSLQVWDGGGLVQNPCDLSNALHATAIRALLTAGAEPDAAAGSTITLLHQARHSGGWPAGGLLPTDLLTTALALDALSLAGDTPVETSWARRRAVMLLLRGQRADGGWPLYPDTARGVSALWRLRGSVRGGVSCVDVTSAAVQALAYSGVPEAGDAAAVRGGVRFLMRTQTASGMWRGGTIGSDVFATVRALEALIAAAEPRSGGTVARAVSALLLQQRVDGGWSERSGDPSTPHHTAWALRALAGSPGVPTEVLARGRQYLEKHIHPSELMWSTPVPAWPLPFGERAVSVPDLTALWGLEALVPMGAPARSRVPWLSRSRSIFNRSR